MFHKTTNISIAVRSIYFHHCFNKINERLSLGRFLPKVHNFNTKLSPNCINEW